MSVFLIGANGLVGSAFARFFKKRDIPFYAVHRENMREIAGATCDLVVNCSGNANKGKAISNPAWDFQETVGSASHYVHAINAKQFVQISSVDVYADPGSADLTKEMAATVSEKQSAYGFHKLLAEYCVRQFASRALILRLPALVGPNLRKNPIYDHFHSEKKLFIGADSYLNIVHTDFVAAATWELLGREVREPVINLAARDSLAIADLPKISGIENSFHTDAHGIRQQYQINTDTAGAYLDLPTSETAVRSYMSDIA